MMKNTIKELKAQARGSLLGYYGTAIAALLFTEIIILLINLPFDQMTQQGMSYMVPSRVIMGTIGSLLVSLLSALLEYGIIRIHLQIARKQKTSFGEIFYAFKNRPDRFLGYSAITLIVTVICMLPGGILALVTSMNTKFDDAALLILSITCGILCIIGCIILIILMLAWALTPYILIDNPNMQVLDAMKLSRQLMKGNKGRLFKLYLSFLGWICFSLLTLGIALLWIIPYMTQTCTWFYLDFITGGPSSQ